MLSRVIYALCPQPHAMGRKTCKSNEVLQMSRFIIWELILPGGLIRATCLSERKVGKRIPEKKVGTWADSRIPVVCCDRWNVVVGMQGEQGSSQGTLIINVVFSAGTSGGTFERSPWMLWVGWSEASRLLFNTPGYRFKRIPTTVPSEETG